MLVGLPFERVPTFGRALHQQMQTRFSIPCLRLWWGYVFSHALGPLVGVLLYDSEHKCETHESLVYEWYE